MYASTVTFSVRSSVCSFLEDVLGFSYTVTLISFTIAGCEVRKMIKPFS